MNIEESNTYWSASSANYSTIIREELHSFRPEEWRRQILDHAPSKPVLNVLDTGCGPGFFSIILSQIGHRVVGIDGAEGMLRAAKENAEQFQVEPVLLQMDCHDLKFCDCTFDLIISRNVTHALQNHELVYKEWYRVLRPGGKLLIFDANWHLDRVDEEILQEMLRREQECIRLYGSNFDGDDSNMKTQRENDRVEAHVLGANIRPQWDQALLERLGYRNIDCVADITDKLWDDKEKLLYGATPMFMIAASK